MTRDKDLKRLARERSQKTGESYSTARRQLVQKQQPGGGAPANDLMAPWIGLDAAAMEAAPLAQDEARIAGHAWVEPEHLLLGLLSQGAVLATLRTMRVSPVALRHHVGDALPPQRDRGPNPTLSVGFLWTLMLARQEAASIAKTAASPEDILIALAQVESPASAVLAEFGAGEQRLRAHLNRPAPPVPDQIRTAVFNRLLAFLGHSVTEMSTLITSVEVEAGPQGPVVTLLSGQRGLLLTLVDDLRAAAETVTGVATVLNVRGAD